ncbi:acyltransferase family protein [Agarivorans sp. TSD2052]|uniref:acyltransferase family protein n=1 Tax=Agarivorans sp. TSD2052 TaxID=2937286 RepID=UPI002010B479|nr:acyltransferase family protein [Agarivorans sp. TSD2052]UPW20329.1 acyltransferase family protein [Agarivorans sp. TSD2052]
MASRVECIDIAKGISISLVVFHHSQIHSALPNIIDSLSLFRMPLFFFLSGVFFSTRSRLSHFILKKAEALLKPYFFVLFILLVVSFLAKEDALIWQLKGIFYATGDTIEWTPMWFLPHLFLLYLMAYCLVRYGKLCSLRLPTTLILLISFFSVGAWGLDAFWYTPMVIFGGSVLLPGLPFSLDIAPITVAYFILGYIFRNRVVSFRPNVFYVLLSIAGFFTVALFTSAHIDFNHRLLVNPIASCLGSLCGIYMALCLSILLAKSACLRSTFTRLGASSLYILIFHFFILIHLHHFVVSLFPFSDYVVLFSIIEVSLAILASLTIKTLIEKNSYLEIFFKPVKARSLDQHAKS